MKITNHNTYGKGIFINGTLLRFIFVVLCILTPATNWAIPFAKKIEGRWIRWE